MRRRNAAHGGGARAEDRAIEVAENLEMAVYRLDGRGAGSRSCNRLDLAFVGADAVFRLIATDASYPPLPFIQ